MNTGPQQMATIIPEPEKEEADMKKYEEPKIEIIVFASQDIITASGGDKGDTQGYNFPLPQP